MLGVLARILCRRYQGIKHLLVLDLDNTLVDSRTFQNSKGSFDVFDHKDFPLMTERAKKFVANASQYDRIVVLTARPYSSWMTTVKYVRGQLGRLDVILTRTAVNKLIFLRSISKLKNIEIVYIDDLSYGMSSIKIYSEIVDQVSAIESVDYKNINWIKENLL